MRSTRRTFLTVAGSTTVVALAGTIPAFLRRAAAAEAASDGENVLVIVQLSGGNDGLNTVPLSNRIFNHSLIGIRVIWGNV